MRTHQSLLKTAINHQLNRTPDDHKLSFLVTFTADEKARAQVAEEFQLFLKKVEKIVGPAKAEHLYQINFDLFLWL